jgi:hypothetical protein
MVQASLDNPQGGGQSGEMDRRLAAAQCLRLDRLALEVIRELAAADVPAVLLKGPSFARWLYDEGAARPYSDVDLLVSPQNSARGEQVLTTLGFALLRPGLSKLEETGHARVWVRQDGMVDFHHSVWGIGVEPTEAWEVLTTHLDRLRIGGEQIPVLALPARALHVALHAAQHGSNERKPLEDLGRAGARASFDTWKQAAALARELKAEGAMAAGLRLDASTAKLADELGLAQAPSLEIALHAQGAPLIARGLGRVAATEGLHRKLAMACRRLVPTPARMRSRYPSAAAGPGALASAYLARTRMLVFQAPAALQAVWRARRDRR